MSPAGPGRPLPGPPAFTEGRVALAGRRKLHCAPQQLTMNAPV